MPSIREQLSTDVGFRAKSAHLARSLDTETGVCYWHAEPLPCSACEAKERQRRLDDEEAWSWWEAMGREDDLEELDF